MKIAGWIIFVVGLAVMGWGFAYDPSFTPDGAQYWERTVNLGLLAEKLTITIIGASLAVCGAILAACGMILATMAKARKRPARRA